MRSAKLFGGWHLRALSSASTHVTRFIQQGVVRATATSHFVQCRHDKVHSLFGGGWKVRVGFDESSYILKPSSHWRIVALQTKPVEYITLAIFDEEIFVAISAAPLQILVRWLVTTLACPDTFNATWLTGLWERWFPSCVLWSRVENGRTIDP